MKDIKVLGKNSIPSRFNDEYVEYVVDFNGQTIYVNLWDDAVDTDNFDEYWVYNKSYNDIEDMANADKFYVDLSSEELNEVFDAIKNYEKEVK